MSKFLKALSVVVIVWLALFVVQEGLTSWLPGAFHFNVGSLGINRADKSEVLSQSSTDLTKIRVETHNGSVTLRGADREGIEIRAHYQSRANSSSRATEMVQSFSTDLTATAGELLVKANFAQESYNNQSVSYEIFLPRNLSASVQTSNGTVTIENLIAEADVISSNGAVSVVSDSGMGDVSIHTSNAKVDVVVPTGLSQLTVESSNGRIEVSGDPGEGHWQLRTSNGGIRIALPLASGVKLDAQTSNSSIDVGDGPWSVNGGKLSNKQVSATRGDGALELIAHTSNSSIEIVDR